MFTYPDYVYKTLARARDEGQWSVIQARCPSFSPHSSQVES